MNRSFKLNIPNPCSEKWNNMDEDGRNKFCQSCQKTIYDFANLSNAEILDKLKKSKEKVCGRFTTEQLNQELKVHGERSFVSYRIFAGSLLLIGLAATPVFAQGDPIVIETETTDAESQQETTLQEDSTHIGQYHIKGIIREDLTNEPIPFASVYIKGTDVITTTDFNGQFILYLPDDMVGADLVVGTKMIGYKNSEIPVSSNDFGSSLGLMVELKLVQEETMVIGLIEYAEKPKWWQFKKRKAFKESH